MCTISSFFNFFYYIASNEFHAKQSISIKTFQILKRKKKKFLKQAFAILDQNRLLLQRHTQVFFFLYVAIINDIKHENRYRTYILIEINALKKSKH